MELFPYPRFSKTERDRRWSAVRALMRQQGIDVIVAPENTGHSMDFQANSRYLSHIGGGAESDVAVIFPLEGEVTAVVVGAERRWKTVQDWTTDVRECRRRSAKVSVERLKELKIGNGRVGVVGLGPGTRSPEGTISYSFMLQMQEAFPKADFVDATKLMAEVRYIKSQEEIEVLIKSTAIVEKGIEAKIAAAKVGALDWEVWAAAQHGMMKNGSEVPVHCNWISGKNPTGTLTRPTMRLLERGDQIIDELEASWIGYRAQGVQQVFVEVAEPIHKDLIKAQRDVFDTLMENLKPGTTVKELAEITAGAARKAIPKSGPLAGGECDLTMHGRGAGDDGPIITNSARSPEQLATRLQESMVFVLKPSISVGSGNSETLCIWGDTVLVTPQGGRRMGKRLHDLAVATAG